jgi:hypothetical protein
LRAEPAGQREVAGIPRESFTRPAFLPVAFDKAGLWHYLWPLLQAGCCIVACPGMDRQGFACAE